MARKFILKFLSNDIIVFSVQILKFHRQLQHSVYCLYLAASSFMSQTERRILNVEWRYLSTEDITIHTSKTPIGDTSEVSLCPTYSFATHIHHRTTNLSYWGGKGAVAAMRSYSILIYQLTPHPPNSLLPHRIFTTPPKPIWDQSSHFPRHLASITPFVHYSVFPHQSKRRYEKYFNISFSYVWMSKIFLY